MTDHVGKQLANYRLIHLVGRVGSADVVHIHLNIQTAATVLQTRLGGNSLKKFRHEVRTIVGSIHPHIIHVLDYGLEEKNPFLVMNYPSLGILRHQCPRDTKLPPIAVVSDATWTATTLQFGHHRKSFHQKARMASDEYPLEVMAYDWLSGDRSFRGSFMEMTSQHLPVPIPPLSGKIL